MGETSNKLRNPFRGLGVALATPFSSDGAVDYEALCRLVEKQLAGGVDFLCVLGTTAETPCLTDEERAKIIRTVVETVHGRVPLLLGAGSNSTQAVVEFLTSADLSGIDGVLIVAPYYNKPSQEGLYQHYRAIAASTPLPVVLYNVPSRTGVNIEAETTLRLARDCDNIVAVKEASGRISQIDKIIANAPAGFEVLSGDDALTYEIIGLGAVGVISVVANALPKTFADMVHACLEGRTQTALPIHRRLLPLYSLLSADGNPAGIKAFLALTDGTNDVLRLPLVPARETTREGMRQWLKQAGVKE